MAVCRRTRLFGVAEWRLKQDGGMRDGRDRPLFFSKMKEIPQFQNYCVTEDGEVWSCLTNRFLKQKTDINGYKSVALYVDTKRTDICVHRLVMWAYVGIQNDGIEVRHKNGIRGDNRLSNLEYGTRSDNAIDRVNHGNNTCTKGERNGRSKLTASDVEKIKHRINDGDKPTDIARDFGVQRGAIYYIKNNKGWL
jgi:hypothetical protein